MSRTLRMKDKYFLIKMEMERNRERGLEDHKIRESKYRR
jgi:hypothetical protein